MDAVWMMGGCCKGMLYGNCMEAVRGCCMDTVWRLYGCCMDDVWICMDVS